MADISVTGTVWKPQVREGKKGKFVTFSLSEGVKDKDGNWQNFYYDVKNFNSEDAPAEKSRVQVRGWLKLRKHEGKTYMDVIAETIVPQEKNVGSKAEDFPF